MKTCSKVSTKACQGAEGWSLVLKEHFTEVTSRSSLCLWSGKPGCSTPLGPAVLLANFWAVLNSALTAQLLGWNSRNLPSLPSAGHLVPVVAIF